MSLGGRTGYASLLHGTFYQIAKKKANSSQSAQIERLKTTSIESLHPPSEYIENLRRQSEKGFPGRLSQEDFPGEDSFREYSVGEDSQGRGFPWKETGRAKALAKRILQERPRKKARESFPLAAPLAAPPKRDRHARNHKAQF